MRMEKNGDKNETFEAVVSSCAHSSNYFINKNESRHQIIISMVKHHLNGIDFSRCDWWHRTSRWTVTTIIIDALAKYYYITAAVWTRKAKLSIHSKHICSESVYSLSLCHCIMLRRAAATFRLISHVSFRIDKPIDALIFHVSIRVICGSVWVLGMCRVRRAAAEIDPTKQSH